MAATDNGGRAALPTWATVTRVSTRGPDPRPISTRALNRATLVRQGLVERLVAPAPEAVARLAGLQAQHADQPYVALWSRRKAQRIADLESALHEGTVVKATLMRTTLHLVAARDLAAYDVATADARLGTWAPSARRAGLDLHRLNTELRAYCTEPRTVAEIEAHLAARHPGVDAAEHVPDGVRNAWFRLGSAAGGLVHVPPSGLWREHGKPAYVTSEVRLGEVAQPSFAEALETTLRRYLAAYGPASVADFAKWAGQRRVTPVRDLLAALGEEVVRYVAPDGRELVDLVDLPHPDEDVPAPPRFLSRWDSLLIAYAVRDRVLPDAHVPAVVRKNGDFLPTFLVDGLVAGRWSVGTEAATGRLRLEPFGRVPRADRAALVEEGERLVRYVEPEADRYDVTWAPGSDL